MTRYSELCSKSCFSFLRGASHPEELVTRAHELGYESLALNDFNGFYGMVRAYDKAKRLSMPIHFGTEINFENSSICLMAKNLAGYRRLCRLLSDGFAGQPKAAPLITRNQFLEWVSTEDVFMILAARDFPSEDLFHWLQSNFKIYQFITKYFSPNPDRKLKAWIKKIPSSIPKIWTWDVFYHDPSRLEVFNLLKAIRENKKIKELDPAFNAERYLHPLLDLKKLGVPKDWIQTGIQLSQDCSFSPSEIRYRYPKEWLPAGTSSFDFLKQLCQSGIKKRFPRGPSSEIISQLEHELLLVKELQYEDYFLTVWDIVQYARSQKILCQGRGSAANSVICYLLEITSIDPVQMNLLFERFISKERNEPPDIDVDFEHERREEVIQYIFRKYGRHRAGMVATLITYKTKSALRDVGKALDIRPQVISELSQKSSWKENIFKSSSPSPCEKDQLLRLVKQIRGFPRHLGQHTGGMILCDDRLDEISPIEPARMANRSLVQWDKYDVEKLGLLKIDILSLGMLTCLRKSLDLLKEKNIAHLELHEIPQKDSKTFEMIGRSQSLGVFQIESRAQMSMLARLKPKNFYDLVIEVAIVRPGPIQGGMVHPYLKRRMGLEKVDYAHPKLKPILEKTLGIPIFQEQVMKMAIEVAGYSPGEADALRRAMGTWKKTGSLENFSQDLGNRLYANGVPREFTDRVCQQILGFGEYGFPESHAASFALLTYASAYLKAHYPNVFLCSLLNSMPMGFYPFHVLTSNFMREGVYCLPVSLNKSCWDHSLERYQDQWAVRLGFRCVKNLSLKNTSSFLKLRDSSPKAFDDCFDQKEKASLAMIRESQKRLYYWKALEKNKPSLPLNERSTPQYKEPDAFERLLLDFEFMQTSLHDHPTPLIKKNQWNYDIGVEKITLSKELENKPNGNFCFTFGMIQIVQSPPTANGMFFITAEDESGFINLVFTPDQWKIFKHLVQSSSFVLTLGKIQKVDSYHSILVKKVYAPIPRRANLYRISPRNTQSPLPQKKYSRRLSGA
jgi:error-prone DNA polymerase